MLRQQAAAPRRGPHGPGPSNHTLRAGVHPGAPVRRAQASARARPCWLDKTLPRSIAFLQPPRFPALAAPRGGFPPSRYCQIPPRPPVPGTPRRSPPSGRPAHITSSRALLSRAYRLPGAKKTAPRGISPRGRAAPGLYARRAPHAARPRKGGFL
jgi:hypothetical protein